MNKSISSRKIETIFKLVLSGIINIRGSSKALKISRNTLKKYATELKTLILLYPDKLEDFDFYLRRLQKPVYPSEKLVILQKLFPTISRNVKDANSTSFLEWEKYKNENKNGFELSHFQNHFSKWCALNGVVMLENKKYSRGGLRYLKKMAPVF